MSIETPLAAIASVDRWDAVVIGAGPAGAVAARQLALQDKHVLLVEKAKLPRDKVCGGCLGGAAVEVLASIGLGRLLEECGGVPLSEFALASESSVARLSIGRRIAVSRRTFDAALVREAEHAGAVELDQTSGTVESWQENDALGVTLRQHSQTARTRASVVIVASGLGPAPAGCRTSVAPRSRLGLGAILDSAPCAMAPGVLHMAISDVGYAGITEVDGGRYDLAAAVDPRALAAAGSAGRLIERIFWEVGWEPRVDLNANPWRGTPRLTRRTVPVGSHRQLLVGDAAGYVEPFTGEGIGWAMHSAVLATSLLTGSLDRWDESLAARWSQLYESSLAANQLSCQVLSQLLRVRAMRRLMTWGLRQAPALSRPFVRRLDRRLATPLL